MDCNKCFIGINNGTKELFIGYGDLKKDGTIKYKNKSDSKTVEIVNALARLMKMRLDKRKGKPYYGFEIPMCGKLILVKDGYDFEVYKKRKDDITRPLRDF